MQNLETENKSGETTTQEMADTAEVMQQEEQTEDNRVTFTAAELEGLIQKAARAAVAEYKKQEEKDRKQNKYHNTFMLMKCYRDAAFHIENAISDGEQLELAGMTDEQQRTYLESIQSTTGTAKRYIRKRAKASRILGTYKKKKSGTFSRKKG